MSTAWLITRHEVNLLRADPYPVVFLVLMPLALLAFLSDGLVGGPGESVPGILVLFAFLGLYNVGLSFFREHGWRTWARLRTLPVGSHEVVVGKVGPVAAMYLLQAGVLLSAGYWLFGMPMRGELITLLVVVIAVVLALSALGFLLVSVCRTMNQVAAVANVGGLVLAGLGGALSPVSTMPEWVQRIAPLNPVYWALLALRGVIVDGDGVTELSGSLVVLLSITVVAGIVGVVLFDASTVKEYYA